MNSLRPKCRLFERGGLSFRAALVVVAAAVALPVPGFARVAEYRLVVHEKKVGFGGGEVDAIAINDSIPAPTLEFDEGDTARIVVKNDLDTETSIHWHGVLVPPEMDGVPLVSFPPIPAKSEFVYEFPIRQAGTYWYHSHTDLQEQRGLFGAIVIHPREERYQVDRDYVLVLSDWTNRNPNEILRLLRAGNDFDSIKRDAVQHVWGALRRGRLPDFLHREWQSMPENEIGDVAYDAFLVNGQPQASLAAEPGETIRLRVINAGSATYFYLQFAGGPMKLISADGIDVDPIDESRVLIGIAETYDFLVTLPRAGAFEFRATAQDGSGHAAAFLGSGEKVTAPDVPPPDYYRNAMSAGYWRAMMNTAYRVGGGVTTRAADGSPAERSKAMPGMAMEGASGMHMKGMAPPDPERPEAPYAKLRALAPTTLPAGRPVREITLNLTGDMERYVWSINGKVLSEDHLIRIRKGEIVRFVLDNRTMMHHPMHLHGHFFRVLNGQGEYSPFKHTIDIPPMRTQVIEFAADEKKDWFFHCHVLYHLEAGMARVVHYEGTEIDPALAAIRPKLYRDPAYAYGEVALLSQMTEGTVEVSNTRNILSADWELEWDTQDYEVELTYDRYVNRYLSLFLGGDLEADDDAVAVFGLRYLLPFNIRARFWVDSRGDVRPGAHKELRLTRRVVAFADAEYDTDTGWEWFSGGELVLTRRFSLVGQYHNEYGGGGGFRVQF